MTWCAVILTCTNQCLYQYYCCRWLFACSARSPDMHSFIIHEHGDVKLIMAIVLNRHSMVFQRMNVRFPAFSP